MSGANPENNTTNDGKHKTTEQNSKPLQNPKKIDNSVTNNDSPPDITETKADRIKDHVEPITKNKDYNDPENNETENSLYLKEDSRNVIKQRKNNSDNGFSSDNPDENRYIDNTNTENDTQKEEVKKKLKRKIILILVIVNITSFIASFSYWIQSGLLPYLTRKLGVTPTIFGYMQSTFALYQLLGSPIFGRCGDVFGCRKIMVVSEIASAVTYGSLAFSTSVLMLFIARIPAFFMHNLQGSYMIITDITLPSERADLIGKLGVSHGLGMIIGSFVGGVVTAIFNEEIAALVAACGNLFSVVIILLFIPDDTKAIRRKLVELYDNDTPPEGELPPPNLTFGVTELYEVLKIKTIRYLLLIKVISGFPFSLLYSMFSMAIMDHFKLGPRENGMILAYIGLLGILTQGVLIGILTKYFSFPVLIKCAVFLNTATFLFIIVAENIIFLCLLLLPLAIGGTLLHIVLTTAVTKVVPIKDTGSALGLSSAVSALVRSVAPSVGGLIFTNLGWPFFGIVGYGMYLSLSCFTMIYQNTDY